MIKFPLIKMSIPGHDCIKYLSDQETNELFDTLVTLNGILVNEPKSSLPKLKHYNGVVVDFIYEFSIEEVIYIFDGIIECSTNFKKRFLIDKDRNLERKLLCISGIEKEKYQEIIEKW